MILATHGIVGSSIVQFTGLLDDYSGAAAAYSLRLLSSTYTGDAIRVRRASDNTEQDIGFVNNELDTSTLTSFCSGTDGFVKTWYDQSGNGYDATQTTAGSQPQIVSSGSVIVENGKPIIKGNDDSDFFTLPIASTTIDSMFATIALDTTDDYFTTSLSDGGGSYFLLGNDGSTSTIIQSNVGSPTNYQNSILYTGSNRDNVYDDFQGQNLLSIIGASPTTWTQVIIGYRSGGPIKMANTQELVIYSSDQSSNRTGIETNINNFYSIYYVATNSEYQAVLDYADSQGYQRPSYAQCALQDALVSDLKSAGIWSKLDTFAVFATDGDSDFALIDWIRLTDYTAVNSPTFTTNQGFQGDGISAYIDTNFNLTTDATNASQNDIFTGVYLRTRGGTNAQMLFGAYDATVSGGHHISSGDRLRCNSSASVLGWTLQTGNYQSVRRNNSSNFDALTESVTANQTISSSTIINKSMYILARHGTSGAVNAPCSSSMQVSNFINSSYLNDTQFNDYVDAFDTYITSI